MTTAIHPRGKATSQPVETAAAVDDRPGDAALVERTHLVNRLIAARSAALTLIVAPAGYGKSALLAEWAEHDERSFACLPLEPAHNDPLTLMRGIVAGLDVLGVVSAQLPARMAGTSSVQAARLLLREAVEHAAGPFVLVLDDAQSLDEPAALDVLSMLITYVRSGSQLALASRTEPRLPVGRLRAHRMLTELRASDLVMTRREAAALVRFLGVHLDADGIELLVQRTEGWPVGLYLAAITARDGPQPGSALACFAGDHRVVAEYLGEEILSGLTPEDLEFLTRTSILERLSGPLCDYVLERQDSGRRLAALSRMNLLLVPLDRTDTAYRYHRLLAQMLHGELRRSEPRVEQLLHQRASAWYAEHGDSDHAIDHAIHACDHRCAGRLLWRHAGEYIGYGRLTRLQAWLEHFSDQQISASPNLALTAAAAELASGDRNLAERWLNAVTRWRDDQSDAPRQVLDSAVYALRAAIAAHGLGKMAEDAAAAYRTGAQDSPWLALACLVQGVSKHLTGDGVGAREQLEEGARRSAACVPAVQVICLAQLALLAIDGEDWSTAELHAALAKAQVERAGLADYATSALVYAVSADVQARIGRVEVSQEDAREARRLASASGRLAVWYETECSIALSRAALRMADVPGAQSLLATAARNLQLMPEAAVAQRWFEGCSAQADMAAEVHARGQWSLTTAELRVLQYLPTHLSFPEIAERLYVSANTVKTHTRAVYRKLDASSRGEAVVRAREAGLLDPPAQAPAAL
jgi:LuxR family maltose regulon positive regulatory protein